MTMRKTVGKLSAQNLALELTLTILAFEKVEIEWQLSEKKTRDVIDSIAARYRILDGKWLLFPPAAQVDVCVSI